MKDALVMGGTEFVSKAIAKYLISLGYNVDIFTRGRREVDYEGIREHLQGDRHSVEELHRELGDRSYNYIFDITAYTKEDVAKLVKVVKRDNLKRYLFCSSGAVYLPNKGVSSEDFPRGRNPHWGSYGLDKALAEDYLFDLYHQEGFPITIFRPTYIYGEGNNLYREAYFFDRIRDGLAIPIPAGEQEVQFVYIGDLVKSFISGAISEDALGKAYNLTNNRAITWKKLLTTAMEVVGKEVELVEVDRGTRREFNLVSKNFFPFRNITFLLSITRLKEDNLHIPETTLKQGLSRAYQWYLKDNNNDFNHSMDKIDFILSKHKTI